MQTVPQAPQLEVSFLVSTHEPLHAVVPPPQSTAQTPALQTEPVAHTLAHAPQFFASDTLSTHWFEQFA
jgi:hypothetical protein